MKPLALTYNTTKYPEMKEDKTFQTNLFDIIHLDSSKGHIQLRHLHNILKLL